MITPFTRLAVEPKNSILFIPSSWFCKAQQRLLWAGITIFTFLVKCSSPTIEGYEIKGSLTNANKVKIYLDLLTGASIIAKDSTITDENGKFVLTAKISDVGFYRLRISQNNFVNTILHNDDRISITGDAQNLFGTYKLQGSRDAILMYELNDYMRKFSMKTDSLRRVMEQFNGSPKMDSVSASMNNAYNTMLDEKKEHIKKFIDNNTNSIACLAAIENLDISSDLPYFINLDKELYKLYPQLEYVKNFHAKVAQSSRLSVGSEAPQILLNDPSGNTIALSSLRGKVVLIDFWASWCKPCRLENPNVVRLYEKYHSKGFEIYGVSLDQKKEAWVQAIQQDGLGWVHVSDLGFWNSAAVKLYDISSIPQTFLIDENGIIIAKGLRADSLEEKLKEIFD